MAEKQENQIHEAAHKFREAVETLTGEHVLITWCIVKKIPFNTDANFEINGGHSISEKEWEAPMLNHAILSSIADLTEIYNELKIED